VNISKRIAAEKKASLDTAREALSKRNSFEYLLAELLPPRHNQARRPEPRRSSVPGSGTEVVPV